MPLSWLTEIFYEHSSTPNAVGQAHGSATVEPMIDQSGDLMLMYPINATSTATCPNGTMSTVTFACVVGGGLVC